MFNETTKLVILLKIILNYDKKRIPEYVSLNMQKKMLSSISKKLDSIKIHVKDSEGRVLCEDISSNINIPEENNSAVDGYAINNNLTDNNKIKIIGESKPGKPFLKKVKKNQAIRIFTGAYLLSINNLTPFTWKKTVLKK